MDKLLDNIRRGYVAKELWIRSGQRICRSFLGYYPTFEWAQACESMIKEVINVQRTRGSILQGELVQSFLLRLTCEQFRANEISADEYSGFTDNINELCHQKDLSESTMKLSYNSITAKGRLLKVCLEIGKKRAINGNKISVHKLMTTDISVPLDRSSSQGSYELITNSPEFHIAAASYYGDYKYSNAVSEIVFKHSSLDEAYAILSAKELLNEAETDFVRGYNHMKKSCSIDWKEWL
ncbi:MAG: hypothetical protein PHF56_24345 [Desulfuromonadaceae bacterium]|nr:hypothetical protein [Desulfuromonadaceae bacterium]